MQNILIAGAGHGGLAAGILLARAGFSVTLAEQKARAALGHDWEDRFTFPLLADLVGRALPPDVWREIIKPLHTEIVKTAHDCGILFVHHADCICQPLVQDMVEMGIDIWQGVIPQNDIVEIQRVTEGKLAMIGGIDGPAVDIANITEDAIRAEVRRAIDTYCPAGRFYPSIPNGRCFREWNNDIAQDEMKRYGAAWAQAHPILPGTDRPSGC